MKGLLCGGCRPYSEHSTAARFWNLIIMAIIMVLGTKLDRPRGTTLEGLGKQQTRVEFEQGTWNYRCVCIRVLHLCEIKL